MIRLLDRVQSTEERTMREEVLSYRAKVMVLGRMLHMEGQDSGVSIR